MEEEKEENILGREKYLFWRRRKTKKENIWRLFSEKKNTEKEKEGKYLEKNFFGGAEGNEENISRGKNIFWGKMRKIFLEGNFKSGV